MRLFARMVESADTEVSKTSALGRVGSSPTLSTSKFSVYKTLSRAFSNISRRIGEQIFGPMAQWERRCFASIRFGVRVPVGPVSQDCSSTWCETDTEVFTFANAINYNRKELFNYGIHLLDY